MTEFFTALPSYAFLQNAIIIGLLASAACGIVGSFVVVRRMTYIAGAIAHIILGGIGAAKFAQVVLGWKYVTPLAGAIISALLAALIIGIISIRFKEREDTVIGALWAIGMAAGILFISQTPGYNEDLMSYLFGNILMVSRSDIAVIAVLDILILLTGALFYKEFVMLSFDEEFAQVRGLNVVFYHLLLLCLTALTVVLLVSVVGIIMVIALLTLPVAASGHFVRSLGQMMFVSSIVSALITTTGLAVSYGPDLPAGPVIILIAGIVYLLAISVHKLNLQKYWDKSRNETIRSRTR